MSLHESPPPRALNLKAGEWVKVRTKEEILSTLDEQGRLENLPFMPEMLQYCGKKLQVFKSAHKTCDYIQGWSIRRMKDAVHLAGVRCDGSGHDGCQASCLIFWKEAWLMRIENDVVTARELRTGVSQPVQVTGRCAEQSITRATRQQSSDGRTIYRCQVTDVPKFTTHMSFWDPRQYIRDLRSGNLSSGLGRHTRGERVLEMTLAILRLLQASIIGFFNEIQSRRHKSHYPSIQGAGPSGAVESLNLQPGELVEVRSKEEIVATLDKGQKNKGLWFDSEMLPYCGGIYRVLRRVNQIIDEKTGKMVTMKNSCIVLEGVVCKSEYHRLCPRAIYPYWREGWLKRAIHIETPVATGEVKDSCHCS
jgi:predicted DNA-binding antitoxin AbrB/MazE fold protein